MPRASAPPWRQLKEPVLDHYVQASLDQANGTPDPDTGHYAELHITGIAEREEAEEYKRALYRAAKRMKVSMSATVHRSGSGYAIHFKAIDKRAARAYVLARYGNDRTKWPYSPRQGDPNYG